MSVTEMSNGVTYQDFVKNLQLDFGAASEDWLAQVRKQAYDRFQTLGFPTKKNENWKYTNANKVLEVPFLPSYMGKSSSEVPDPDFFEAHLPADEVNRMTFINGTFSEGFTSKFSLPKPVIFGELSTVLSQEAKKIQPFFGKDVEQESNAFACVNTFSFQQGAVIYVPDNIQVETPVHLFFAGMGDKDWPKVFYPRVLVILGKDAKLNLLMNHLSLNEEAYFMNAVSEIHVGAGSKLDLTLVQRQSDKSSQFSLTRTFLDENSSFNAHSFVRGGEVTHNEMEIHFKGENASCDVQGLSLLCGHSQASQTILANHETSHGQSKQEFKNILTDTAQAEFNSIAHVRKDTKGCNSDQLNRNLVLSDKARAFSRPTLKIDADDVAAAHGSATGQLDEKELFYLRSRGLDEAFSKFVLTFGFAEEILQKIPHESMRWQLELLVRKEIESMLDPGREEQE